MSNKSQNTIYNYIPKRCEAVRKINLNCKNSQSLIESITWHINSDFISDHTTYFDSILSLLANGAILFLVCIMAFILQDKTYTSLTHLQSFHIGLILKPSQSLFCYKFLSLGMTITWHLCLWNTFWIQGHRDVIFNNTLYLRWKFWVSVGLIAFKRKTDKWDVPIILTGCRFLLFFFFLWHLFSFSFWGWFSQRTRNVFPLWDHRDAKEGPEAKCTDWNPTDLQTPHSSCPKRHRANH